MPKKRIKYEKKEKEDVCELCGQNLSEVKLADIPDNPQKEIVTIKDTDLHVTELLEYRIFNFQIYDRNHHLVPIELIDDREKEFYFSAAVMAIVPTETEKSVMTISSPIISSSIDHNEMLIMLSTNPSKEQVDYTLMDPHPLYQDLYNEHMHMVQLVNAITKRCEEAFDHDEDLGYDELLEYICDQKEFSSEDILNYISFICKHILSYEEVDADDDDTFTLMNFPATTHILDQGGYDIPKRTREKKELNDITLTDSESENDNLEDEDYKQKKEKEEKQSGHVFTTQLVTSMCKFMTIDNNHDNNSIRTREKEEIGKIDEPFQVGEILCRKRDITWYKYLMFSGPGGKVETGSYVQISEEGLIGYGHVIDILEIKGQLCVHFQDLDSKNTIVDQYYHQFKNELFKSKRCQIIPANYILPARVKHRFVDPEEWRRTGLNPKKEKETDCLLENGTDCLQEKVLQEDSEWTMMYDFRTGRFQYPTEQQEEPECFCNERIDSFYKDNIDNEICIEDDVITGISSSTSSGFKLEKFGFYYLCDDADKILGLNYKYPGAVKIPKVKYRDENYYHPRRQDTMDPFIIIQVRGWNPEGELQIRVFYRPENTCMSYEESKKKNHSCLYFSKKDKHLNIETLQEYLVTTDVPTIVYGSDEDDLAEWCHQDPHRFYVTQKYNKSKECYEPLKRIEAMNHRIPELEDKIDEEKTTFKEVQPLKTLDIFSGAGGLSTGLEESGAAKIEWAIECDVQAAKSFKCNHSNVCKVITEDCNIILKNLVNHPNSSAVKDMPSRGEVDMIVGGPPCQGFSKLNHSRFLEPSKFKNSQVANYLGFVDFYRPRFVLMENVRNLVFSDSCQYYESILATLVHMGYQITNGILQAGNYGIAQWRRRFFIIAAAPGETLPLFPEPTTVFPGDIYQDIETLSYPRSIYFHTNRNPGAPRRMVTTWDIIWDLPRIVSSAQRNGMNYAASVRNEDGEELPCSKLYFRNGGSILYDHICSNQGDINKERIKRLPKHAGADWRDLPNINVKIDGKMAKEIVYKEYCDKNGNKEGVCHCILSKDKVNEHKQQNNTFIPYFLVHTAHRKRNWEGTFGRVPWDGFFQTTLTSPSVTGKQGQVIHPEQNRICSVREFARSQGFRDTFRFEGTIADKYKQVGNAVPPPLAKAIGLEIRKCLVKKELSNEFTT